MSEFKEVGPLEFGGVDVLFRAAWLLRPEGRINVCAAFSFDEARALRDWLNRALGEEP